MMETIISNLRKKGFKTTVVTKFEEAVDFIKQIIPENAVIAISNSISSKVNDLTPVLKNRNSKILESWDGSPDYNRSIDTFEPVSKPDFFISNSAFITSDGELLVNDSIYQHPETLPKNTIWIASMNKSSIIGSAPGNTNAHSVYPDNRHTVILVPTE